MSNQINESTRLNTLRFSFPSGLLENVQSIKIIGQDLLFYVSEDASQSIVDSVQNMGFKVVDRVYKLHASAQDEESFKNILGDIEHELRDSGSRYIATINLDSKDEYDRILALNCETCFVKPFKAKYSAIRRNNDDNSDTNERVQYNKSQRSRQNFDGPRTYDPRQRSDGQRTYAPRQRSDDSNRQRSDGPRTYAARQSDDSNRQRSNDSRTYKPRQSNV